MKSKISEEKQRAKLERKGGQNQRAKSKQNQRAKLESNIKEQNRE